MQKLNLELSTSQIACTIGSLSLWCDLPVHSMYWPTGLQRLMLQEFSTTSKSYVVGLRSTLNLPLALMDSTPLCLFPLRLMRYISVLHYLCMWLHFDIYIDVLCVPAYRSRDDTNTQRLGRLRSGRYREWKCCEISSLLIKQLGFKWNFGNGLSWVYQLILCYIQ